MKENKRLFKNTIILGIGQFIPKFITLLTIPLLTKSFTTGDYGLYELILSFSSLALPILTLLIQQAVFRFLIEDDTIQTKKDIISNSFFFVLLTSFCYLFITNIISLFLFKKKFIYICIAIFIYVFESFYDLFGQIARALEKNIIYSIASIIFSILSSLLIIFGYYVDFINIISVLVFIMISYLISTLYIFLKLRIYKYINIKNIKKNFIFEMLKYSIPIIPSSISLWIVNLSDRLIITFFQGISLNGVYSAACKIPNLFGTIYGVFNLAWTETASRTIKNSDRNKYYSDMSNALLSFFCGCLMFAIIFGNLAFKLLIDNKFNDGINQLPFLFIGVVLSCLVSYYGGIYVALKKTKKVGISSIVGSIINIIINLLFINKYGIYAASISTVISFFIILVYRIIDIEKDIKIKYDSKSIFIGIVIIIVLLIFYYNNLLNNIFCFCLVSLLSIIYNFLFNKLINKILKFIKRRV